VALIGMQACAGPLSAEMPAARQTGITGQTGPARPRAGTQGAAETAVDDPASGAFDLRPQEIAPGVWFVQGHSALGTAENRNFISNAAFVVTSQSVVVIDALGSPALARQLLRQMARITPLPVSHVIVTHYHADHIYGLQALQQAGAKVVAHEASLAYVHSDTARLRLEASRQELAPWIDANTRIVPPDVPLAAAGVDLEVGGTRFVLRHVGPSHTPEDLAVYLPEQKVLFAGDLVFRGRVPFVGQADSRRWIDALDRMLAFQAEVIVPGHGPASRDGAADLQLTRDYLEHLRRSMGEAARQLEPFEEAYARTDWSRFERLPLFKAANRINAYNTYLLMEREAP
jgi:glyoxylase-like metal-dependent hydrolase (beta-lactamase superfamily II)